jgi:CRP-like cAMP-binding protein
VLLHCGAPDDSVLLLLSGRVRVCTSARGGRGLRLALAGPGDLVGELSAIDGRARTADVVAMDRVRFGVVSGEQFRAFLERHPAAALALMRVLAERVRVSDRERVQLAVEDGFARVAVRLLELAETYGEPGATGTGIELSMTQEDLAGWIGASRITVARALKLMRSLGWVQTSRRVITVLDAEALRARSLALAG